MERGAVSARLRQARRAPTRDDLAWRREPPRLLRYSIHAYTTQAAPTPRHVRAPKASGSAGGRAMPEGRFGACPQALRSVAGLRTRPSWGSRSPWGWDRHRRCRPCPGRRSRGIGCKQRRVRTPPWQSASWRQFMQWKPWTQEAALPVVVSQSPPNPVLVVHGSFVPPQEPSCWPAWQPTPASWLLHVFLPCLPRQMAQQHCPACLHKPPTSTQPKALRLGFVFRRFLALATSGRRAAPRPSAAAKPPRTKRRLSRSKCRSSIGNLPRNQGPLPDAAPTDSPPGWDRRTRFANRRRRNRDT
jgi:hypothetical protein